MKDITKLKFLAGCKAADIVPQIEYEFAKEALKRKWRTDFYFESEFIRLAVEVEGGVWSGGRHTTGAGFVKDMEKYNAYTMLGIRLIRLTTDQIDKQPIACAMFLKSILLGYVDKANFAILYPKPKPKTKPKKKSDV